MADTTSAAPSEREQFEKYAKKRGYRLDRTMGGRTYLYAQAAVAWRAWQAARAVPPPQPVVREPLTDEQAMELVSAAMQQHGITLTGHGVAFAVDVAKRAHGIA